MRRVALPKMTLLTALATVLLFLIYNNISNPRNSFIIPLCLIAALVLGRDASIKAGAVVKSAGFLGTILLAMVFHSAVISGFAGDIADQLRNMVLAYVYHLFLIGLFHRNLPLLRRTVNAVIVVFAGGFVAQLTVFALTGEILDLRLMISGAAGKFADPELLRNTWGLPVAVARFTSFFNEPGTYSSIMAQLVLVSFMIDRVIKPLHVIALLTMLLSFSTFGIVLAVLLLIYIAYDEITIRQKSRHLRKLGFSVGLAMASIPLSYFAFRYISGRFLGGTDNDGGWGFREYWINSWLNSDLAEKISGLGVGFYDLRYAIDAGIFIQDVGMWFHSVVNLGALSLLCLAAFWWYAKSASLFLGLLVLLLVKDVFYSYSMLATLALVGCIAWERNIAAVSQRRWMLAARWRVGPTGGVLRVHERC